VYVFEVNYLMLRKPIRAGVSDLAETTETYKENVEEVKVSEKVTQLLAVTCQVAAASVIAYFLSNETWKEIKFPLYNTKRVYFRIKPPESNIVGDFTYMEGGVKYGYELQITEYVVFLGWGIASFLALSALFESCGISLFYRGVRRAKAGKEYPFAPVYVLRFIEYSITASIMLVLIAVQLGIAEIYTIGSIAALSAICMLSGITGELAIDVTNAEREPNVKVAWVAFWTGTLAQVCAWLPTLIQFYFDFKAAQGIPDFVIAIVFGEAGLWGCFGAIQFFQIWKAKKNTDFDSRKATQYYALLSIVSKQLLAWLIVSQVIVN